MFNTGPLELTGPGAGDRDPYVEMEIMWTPEGDGDHVYYVMYTYAQSVMGFNS